MKPTYISRPVQVFDIPIPEKPSLGFVYNFFLKDERLNDSAPSLRTPFNNLSERDIQQYIPRYITVSWKKSTFDKIHTTEMVVNQSLVESNSSKIIDESNILQDYHMTYFQDLDYKNRIGKRFQSSAKMRGFSDGSGTDIAANLMMSRIEAAPNSYDDDSSETKRQSAIIQRYISTSLQSRDYILKDGILIEPSTASADDQIALVVDNNYSGKSSKHSAFSPVSSAALAFRKNTSAMSSKVKKRKDKMMSSEEAEIVFPSISQEKISAADNSFPKIFHIGHVLERYEVGNQDVISSKKVRYFTNPNVTSFVDLEIKYGAEYVYNVRSLIMMTATTVIDDEFYRSTFLIASRPSTFSSIVGEEHVPPPVPPDFNFHWDYSNASLQLNWSFPVNRQRDIKGWQVFRRKTIKNPYELIAYLDFDDSMVKTPMKETIDKSLIKKFKSSTSFFVDNEFDKDSDYIYAICAVDAHGMTSNYSQQFRVMFDRIQNKIIKHLISQSGAPKQYPNMYLKRELSIDSVKSSKCVKMKVYFDPEYLKVTNNEGSDLKFLKTQNRDGLYRIMMLNTDRQLQSNIDISVLDLRNI